MLELYYSFSTKICDADRFEELEMDTDSLYLALAEKELVDCIRTEMKAEWEQLRSKDFTDSFTAAAVGNFFPRMCCDKHKKQEKRESGVFKEEFRYSEMLRLSNKTHYCNGKTSDKLKFSSKGLNKRILEQTGDGPLEKHRKVLDERVNIKSTNRGFRTKDHTVVTYEQTKRGLSYFYPTRIAGDDGNHRHPLNVDL